MRVCLGSGGKSFLEGHDAIAQQSASCTPTKNSSTIFRKFIRGQMSNVSPELHIHP